MNELSMLELLLFSTLFTLEQIRPARHYPVFKKWLLHWLGLMVFASVWLAGLLLIWPFIPAFTEALYDQLLWVQVLVTYLVFSFVAYWYHRIRHSLAFLWHYVHYMHHAPAQMNTLVTFWRHPVEMLLDSLVILLVGKMLGINMEVIFCVLIIESMLELFHHSNIATPMRLRWLGYFVQLPEQHLIHHQRGLHRWNYGTLTLWDTLFGTVRIPRQWHGRVGLPEWNDTTKLLFFRY